MERDNRKGKGESVKVEPIKSMESIAKIKSLLKFRPRDYALFVIGINTNLRASDLCRIKVGHVRTLEPGQAFELKEKKTGKYRRVTMNGACISAVKTLLAAWMNPGPDDWYLFQNNRTGNHAITENTIYRYVKTWCRAIGLKGNYGSHTLRKTWGYHQRTTFGVDLARLTFCFNHSSPRQTLDYLCIQPEEINDVFNNEL